jgi:hypothetical protein
LLNVGPRQFATRGDKLVFSNSIVILAIFASVLVVAFGGDTSRLINGDGFLPVRAFRDFVGDERLKTVMLRTVWAKLESRRRLFLIDERCDFIELVKLYLDHLAHDGRH